MILHYVDIDIQVANMKIEGEVAKTKRVLVNLPARAMTACDTRTKHRWLSPIPEGWHSVTPRLRFARDAGRAR